MNVRSLPYGLSVSVTVPRIVRHCQALLAASSLSHLALVTVPLLYRVPSVLSIGSSQTVCGLLHRSLLLAVCSLPRYCYPVKRLSVTLRASQWFPA